MLNDKKYRIAVATAAMALTVTGLVVTLHSSSMAYAIAVALVLGALLGICVILDRLGSKLDAWIDQTPAAAPVVPPVAPAVAPVVPPVAAATLVLDADGIRAMKEFFAQSWVGYHGDLEDKTSLEIVELFRTAKAHREDRETTLNGFRQTIADAEIVQQQLRAAQERLKQEMRDQEIELNSRLQAEKERNHKLDIRLAAAEQVANSCEELVRDNKRLVQALREQEIDLSGKLQVEKERNHTLDVCLAAAEQVANARTRLVMENKAREVALELRDPQARFLDLRNYAAKLTHVGKLLLKDSKVPAQAKEVVADTIVDGVWTLENYGYEADDAKLPEHFREAVYFGRDETAKAA